jgi:hypothetical protein
MAMLGWLALALLFQPVGGGWNVGAQGSADVAMDARVGFDGFCKDGQWLPIHVEVENTGADLDVTVKAAYTNGNDGETSTSIDVALAAGSRKEFFLYIFMQGFAREFRVSVMDGKRVLETVNLTSNCLTAENMVIGVISDTPAAFDVLSDVKPLAGFTRLAHLTVSDLPDKAQAWSTLDALVISNVDTGILTPEQKDALETWIASGGKLFVAGGLRWQETVAGINEFLPIDVKRTQTAFDLSELQAYVEDQSPLEAGAVLSVGAKREGAQVLVEQDGVPLLVQKQLGFGSVYFFAADPALEPLSDWEGMSDLYLRLLAYRAPTPRWFNGAAWYNYNASQALGAIPQLGLPSVMYVICLLGLYVIIIGPLNFLLLRRAKRRELAWVTIPVLVAVFSCLAYGTGFFFRGTTPILNRLVLAQAWDGVDQARVRALVGVYSPLRARYDLEAALNFLPSPFAGENGNIQANGNWALVQNGTETILPDVRVEIGGMKAVTLDGKIPSLPITHDLVLEVGRTNPSLSGTIVNQSDFILRDAYLITPSGWNSLGDIGAGRSKFVSRSLVVDTNNTTAPLFDPYSMFGYGAPFPQNDIVSARRFAFLQTVMSYDYQRVDTNWGIYLLGWADQPVLPVSLRDHKSDSVDTMLYIHSLTPNVKISATSIKIPISLMTWESNSLSASPYYTSSIPPGGYELRFKPAFPIPFREVESLMLTLFTSALPGELTVSTWDFDRQTWVPVSRTSQSMAIPSPARYVSSSGEVRLKITTTRSDWVEVRGSFVTLVVKP